ncbi:YbaK/EbsC family protein [Rothia uropygioeca]|uniref:YbaK/EbsC family protein n=1 Tax=Kocuria sp. 257 TaxID=2021970 RepID=UPI0010111457|nr:YbaK/EbsC family protein [Kocuria sp. 257]
MATPQGNLKWNSLVETLELVAPPVADAVRAGAVPHAEVASISEELADTAEFCDAYDVAPEASANCVIVRGKRGETTTDAAVIVLATDRADVNKTVRKHLDARKVSFADQSSTEEATGMTSGGITPVGLPADWKILVDRRVAESPLVVIGGGVRGSKLLVPGSELAELPGAEVLDLAVSSPK